MKQRRSQLPRVDSGSARANGLQSSGGSQSSREGGERSFIGKGGFSEKRPFVDKRTWIPARPPKRGAKPALLAEVLVATQSYVSQRSGGAMTHDEWRNIVGERIAGRTRVGKNFRGLLTIKVASSAWCNELSFLKEDIIGKLVRAGHDVRELRFRVDAVGQRAPNRRTAARPSAERPAQVALSPELESRLANVEDPNLRAAIAEAARACLKNK